jgi:hypothetical protein
MTWAKFLSIIASLVKPLAAFFIYMAGKRAARTEIEAEQNAVNAAALEQDAKIEMEDRTEGPWLR